jgi:hypothetical protein
VTEETTLEVFTNLLLNKTGEEQLPRLDQADSQNVTQFAECSLATEVPLKLQLASFFELRHQAAAN